MEFHLVVAVVFLRVEAFLFQDPLGRHHPWQLDEDCRQVGALLFQDPLGGHHLWQLGEGCRQVEADFHSVVAVVFLLEVKALLFRNLL